jgi:hypothetical protein
MLFDLMNVSTEDRALAEEGMSDYAVMLQREG